MGRWAQRRIAGGGGVAYLANINSAQVDSVNVLFLTWSSGVNAANLTATDFVTNGGHHGVTVTQPDDNSTYVNFGLDISDEVTLTYNGHAAGINTPQTIAIT